MDGKNLYQAYFHAADVDPTGTLKVKPSTKDPVGIFGCGQSGMTWHVQATGTETLVVQKICFYIENYVCQRGARRVLQH